MALVLEGTVVSFDPEVGELDAGAVYLDDGGLIEAVQPAADAPLAGYEGSPRLRTDGAIYPGLIDLHNHLAYNFRPLWIPPSTEPYTTREQWPREEAYTREIRDPANTMGAAAGKAVLKFAEVKALVGGVTAIQESAKGSRPYEGWLVRNVEFETFGTGEKTVYQSVRTLGSADFEGVREHLEEGAAFIYHLSEGTSEGLVDEYTDLRDHGCVRPGLAAIHATALGPLEFTDWGPRGGAIVWSPLSNICLYRATTDVVSARDAGLTVCLGSDWSPSGSKSLLGELKVADLWNREQLDGAFTQEELARMVTTGPARGLGWSDRIGRVVPGLHADLLVTSIRDDDLFRNLVGSNELDVLLTVVGGRPIYGTGELMRAAAVPSTEPIYVAGARRTIRLLDPDLRDADMTWPQVIEMLELARVAPATARSLAAAGEIGEEPFRLIPDMPGDELSESGALGATAPVTMPPLDTLFHDAAFFTTLERSPIAGGLLNGLRDRFVRD